MSIGKAIGLEIMVGVWALDKASTILEVNNISDCSPESLWFVPINLQFTQTIWSHHNSKWKDNFKIN